MGTQLGKKSQKLSKEERKVKSFYGKKYITENYWLTQDWSRAVIGQMSGGQDNGCQMV